MQLVMSRSFQSLSHRVCGCLRQESCRPHQQRYWANCVRALPICVDAALWAPALPMLGHWRSLQGHADCCRTSGRGPQSSKSLTTVLHLLPLPVPAGTGTQNAATSPAIANVKFLTGRDVLEQMAPCSTISRAVPNITSRHNET